MKNGLTRGAENAMIGVKRWESLPPVFMRLAPPAFIRRWNSNLRPLSAAFCGTPQTREPLS